MSLEIGLLRGLGDAPGNDNLPQYFRLPAAENSSLEVVRDLCAKANESQSFYRSVSTKQWLRTVVSLDGRSIHSNVVLRDAYLDSGDCLDPHRCRGFSPVTDIGRENPNRNCRSCALAQQMHDEVGVDRQIVDADQTKGLLRIEEDQVTKAEHLAQGSVFKIVWRSGTFVRKRFDYIEIFEEEVKVATAVSHPNLVHYFGTSVLESDGSVSGSCGKRFSLFMEWLKYDLQMFLEEAVHRPESFPFHERLDVLLQVAKAMKYLHDSGFVHGDLKPQNVFLSLVELAHTEVQCYLVKVGDFGCTKRVDEPFCAIIGTTNYTAPEVFKCRYEKAQSPQDPQKIDVFSFGVVAFQVLTGAVTLYEGCEHPRHVKKAVMKGTRPDSEGQGANLDGLSLSMRTLVKRCWAENPEERPSFSEICDELNRCSKKHELCDNLENPEERPSFPQVCDELNRCSKEHGLCGNLAKPKQRWCFWR